MLPLDEAAFRQRTIALARERRIAMPLSYDQAREQLRAWTANPSLLGHARAVEIAMRAAASKYGDGADAQRWAIAGLLHDADYDRWPEEHPARIVEWLRQQGEEEVAHAVAAHNTHLGTPYESLMDKALLGCDELSGFIVACCLVRPAGIRSLESKSVRKKLKDKAFAAKVDRDEIRRGAELLGVDLDEHIRFLIDALRPHAEELGIAGKG
jgi:predicted hydrolase (HD superfamily)